MGYKSSVKNKKSSKHTPCAVREIRASAALLEFGALLGLPEPATGWVLERLAKDGFLARSPDGLYMRRQGEL